ncbi:MAG TPA: hypothetical protein VJ299_09645 [Steroidobacteraceae bacterium]|jgi:hypothetical protein|nr:hypothetical protein [Steroidobacteraceae bacterium]HJY42855.1 hypothetical protein [Steroidobacteraceae bacterium]
MSDPKDRDPRDKPPPSAPADDSNRSGRPGVDERGNTVWEWKLETGVYSRDISTQKLKKLDLGDLSIAETASHQRPEGLGADKKPPQKKLPGGGFNPYDSSSSGGAGGNPYDNARSFGKKPQPAPTGAPPARKPMDLKRLEEWMQIKKRLEQQKKDEDDED